MSITHSVGDISDSKGTIYSNSVHSITYSLQALENTSADCWRGGTLSSRKKPICWSKACLFPKAHRS